jgi:hypothetical protein
MLSAIMLNVIMLNVANNPFMLSVVMLSVVMLSVVMLSVVMLSVVAPYFSSFMKLQLNSLETILNLWIFREFFKLLVDLNKLECL